MPLPEGYLPRDGDVLVLHGTVRFNFDAGDHDVHVILDRRFTHTSTTVPLDQVVGIHSRKWEPGDQVRSVKSLHHFGEVVATIDGWVWVKYALGSISEGTMQTFEANDLEAVGGGEPFAEPPPMPQPAPSDTEN